MQNTGVCAGHSPAINPKYLCKWLWMNGNEMEIVEWLELIIGYSVTNRWVCRLRCVYQCKTRWSWLGSASTALHCPSSCPPAHHNRHLKHALFSYASSSTTLYHCDWLGRSAKFKTSVAPRLASLFLQIFTFLHFRDKKSPCILNVPHSFII